ncbi:MAG: hypothetical protein AAB729_05205 [Patescibacteria group bacterium]
MDNQPQDQQPINMLFVKKSGSTGKSKINFVGFIYIVFVIGFPLVTLQGWALLLFYPVLLCLSLFLSVWVSIRLGKGYLYNSQVVLLAEFYGLTYLTMLDAGDGSGFYGIEVLIGHLAGTQIYNHFLPVLVTKVLGIFTPIFLLLYIYFSIKFITLNNSFFKSKDVSNKEDSTLLAKEKNNLVLVR